MSLKLWMTIKAVVVALFGLGFLLIPAWMGTLFGTSTDETGLLLPQAAPQAAVQAQRPGLLSVGVHADSHRQRQQDQAEQDTGKLIGWMSGDQSSSFQLTRQKMDIFVEGVRADPAVAIFRPSAPADPARHRPIGNCARSFRLRLK